MTQEKQSTSNKARLIRERNEYHLQVYEWGEFGYYWKTVKRLYFPHLAKEAKEDYDYEQREEW